MTERPRVGVVTINDDDNFGNRLQAFALQRVIAANGFDVELIRNTPTPMRRSLVASRAVHAIRNDGALAFARRNLARLVARGRAEASGPARYAARRRAAISRFAAAHLVSSAQEFTELPPRHWAARYETVIVGSDQVWNPGFRNANEIDFLTFADSGRRVAYAASFGLHEIPTFLHSAYRRWLTDIPSLSVREQRAAEIVHELTGRRVPVVLDPTLLLTREEWGEVRRPAPTTARGRFAVRFFLGHAEPRQAEWARSLAAERDVALIDLNDLDHDTYADIDPLDFVSLLAEAEFVATDSFHATVFALLHHTPVVVRSRDNTDSRVHTLLDQHGITPRETGISGLTSALEPDWARADARRADACAASLAHLCTAIGALRGSEV